MKKFYNIISFVFQPLLMPTYGIAMLINLDVFDVLPFIWRMIAIIGTLLFTGILPAVPILMMLRRGEVNDLFISKREERTMPYLFTFLAYIFWTLFMWRVLNFPVFMVAAGIGTAISILLITFINLKWKISAHLSGIGGLVGGIFGICYRMAYNPIWLFVLILFISALVAISRIALKAHTPGQTLAGFSLGFISVFLPCFFL
ncbi:MAG: phosphoesterase PA-phosphatase related protein [Bacteroidetes bacterium]|nr:phosphoesterase PA-phosphatase related protein [Bacteroidota bacterium]